MQSLTGRSKIPPQLTQSTHSCGFYGFRVRLPPSPLARGSGRPAAALRACTPEGGSMHAVCTVSVGGCWSCLQQSQPDRYFRGPVWSLFCVHTLRRGLLFVSEACWEPARSHGSLLAGSWEPAERTAAAPRACTPEGGSMHAVCTVSVRGRAWQPSHPDRYFRGPVWSLLAGCILYAGGCWDGWQPSQPDFLLVSEACWEPARSLLGTCREPGSMLEAAGSLGACWEPASRQLGAC